MAATPNAIHSQTFDRHSNWVPTTVGWRRIRQTRRVLLFLPWLGLVWQGVLAQTTTDWLSAFLAASGAFLIFFDTLRPQRLYRYPLSTLILLGFGVTLQCGPLWFTALEGNSITVNLQLPVATFGNGFLASLIALTGHWAYRKAKLSRQLRNKTQQWLIKLQIFAPLDLNEMVPMAALGLAAYAAGPVFVGQGETANIFIKFLEGFRFFATIPVAFLLQTLAGSRPWNYKANTFLRSDHAWMLFLLYSLSLVVVGLLGNSRATFIFPLSCLLLGLALYWVFGLIRIQLKNLVAFGLAIVVGLPVITDLATAMVMNRSLRGDIPPLVLVEQTLQQMADRESIQRFRRKSVETGLAMDWNENYVSNPFLARFSNAKFPDNSLENQSHLSASKREEMLMFHWHRLISTLPAPILRLFGVSDQIKAEANSVSYGDKLYFLATGNRFVLGGLRTGHFFGTGLAAFGFFYLALLLASFLIIFPLIDSHALGGLDSKGGPPLVSAIAITQLLSWFTISNIESVVNLLAYPIRGFLEPIVLFIFFRWVARPLKLL